MGIHYWQDQSDSVQVARTMQAIAIDPDLWSAYAGCGQKGRAVFQQCAADEYDWMLDTVLAYAAYEENPPPTVTPPIVMTPIVTMPVMTPPKVTKIATPTVKVRARGKEEDTNGTSFSAWMLEIKAATDQDKALAYECGIRRALKKTGTVAVSVGIRRGAKFIPNASFVFHYHPGVSGATVGHGEGSKWHFKPYDGADKWVRVPEHHFGDLDAAMVKRVKDIARNK